MSEIVLQDYAFDSFSSFSGIAEGYHRYKDREGKSAI